MPEEIHGRLAIDQANLGQFVCLSSKVELPLLRGAFPCLNYQFDCNYM
jgi:hypothetical protein